MIRFLLIFSLLVCGFMVQSQQLDESFGNRGDGFVYIRDVIHDYEPIDLKIADSGLFVLATCGSNCDSTFFIFRFDANGMLDSTFGDFGTLTQPTNHAISYAEIEVKQGCITVLTKNHRLGSIALQNVFRYTNMGAPDTSFNTDGILSLVNDTVFRLSHFMDSVGGIYTISRVGFNNNAYRGIERFTKAGELDTFYGFVPIPAVNDDEVGDVQKMCYDTVEGAVYVTSGLYQPGGSFESTRLFVEKINLSGDYFLDFGTNGVYTSDVLISSFAADPLIVYDIDILESVLAVNTNASSTSGEGSAVVRFTRNGVEDDEFATEGILFDPSGGSLTALHLTDGDFYTLGSGVTSFGIHKYRANGTVDGAFGNQGTFDVVPPEPATINQPLIAKTPSTTELVVVGISKNNQDAHSLVMFKVRDTQVGIGKRNAIASSWLSPNPAQNTLHLPQELSSQNLKLYNSQGQQFEVVQPSVDQLDVSRLAAGMYVLQAGERVWRFVKE